MPRRPARAPKGEESTRRVQRREKLNPQEIAIRRDFSRRLQPLMQQREVNNAEVARAIGVFRGQIGEWLAGTAFPYPANLAKLAKYFRIPMTELAPENVYAPSTGMADVEMKMVDDKTVWLTVKMHVQLPYEVGLKTLQVRNDAKKQAIR